MAKIDKFLVDGSDYEISLTKLVGKKIKDVRGYIDDIGGGASFKLTGVIFEDGSEVAVEGEHDFPYITTYIKWEHPNLDEDTLEAFMSEED